MWADERAKGGSTGEEGREPGTGGDGSLSSTGQGEGNEGMGAQPGIHQERRGEERQQRWNWLENPWGAALPAGNAVINTKHFAINVCSQKAKIY